MKKQQILFFCTNEDYFKILTDTYLLLPFCFQGWKKTPVCGGGVRIVMVESGREWGAGSLLRKIKRRK